MSAKTYYNLEANKLAADGETVALFTSHPGSLGAFREARLRDYLRGHTPLRLKIENGFICDHHDGSPNARDLSSRQIDCLVHDDTDFAPLITSESFSAVYPHAVKAAIEVKSDLTLFRKKDPKRGGPSPRYPFAGKGGAGYRWDGTLIEALENIKSAADIMSAAEICHENYFLGIVSYKGRYLKALENYMAEIVLQLNITSIKQLPRWICTIKHDSWGFSAYEYEDDPALISTHDSSESVLIRVPKLTNESGAALQHFTAAYANALNETVGRRPHRTGGLRSAVGLDVIPENTRFALDSSAYAT